MRLATPQSADFQSRVCFREKWSKNKKTELNFSLFPGLENIGTVGLIPYGAGILDKIIGSGTCI